MQNLVDFMKSFVETKGMALIDAAAGYLVRLMLRRDTQLADIASKNITDGNWENASASGFTKAYIKDIEQNDKRLRQPHTSTPAPSTEEQNLENDATKPLASCHIPKPKRETRVVSAKKEIAEEKDIVQSSKIEKGPQGEVFARGLRNLGNTCFANCVLQCFAHSPFMHTLMTDFTAGSISLPGGTYVIEGDEMTLPPLQTQAPSHMKVSLHLKDAMTEITAKSEQYFTPRALMSEFFARMPQYVNGDQQDAHEFLRHLMETLRDESVTNYFPVILDKVHCSEQFSKDKALAVASFCSAQATETYLPTNLFRGVLVSSKTCIECGFHSHCQETFVDINLPLSEDLGSTHALRIKAEAEKPKKPAQRKARGVKRKVSQKSRTKVKLENVSLEDGTQFTEGTEASTSVAKPLNPGYLCNTRLMNAAGQLSVHSLLFSLTSFTSPEVLTNGDRVCCEECTKRIGHNDKSMLTDTAKQLLIYQPPPVLVLQLKRFQLKGNQLIKLNTFVEFPSKLDIAPYCAMMARDVESIEANQDKIMYSLYGVIEHKGSMQRGHYVAYVKVRKHVPKEHYRWNFIPNVDLNEAVRNIEDAGDDGKWYLLDDDCAKEVREADVLAASAYVLFYERIS